MSHETARVKAALPQGKQGAAFFEKGCLSLLLLKAKS